MDDLKIGPILAQLWDQAAGARAGGGAFRHPSSRRSQAPIFPGLSNFPTGNFPGLPGLTTNSWVSVRREKAWFFSRCNSYPAKVAPVGSYRSGGGGNETVEAFETTRRLAVWRASRP
jgi:hypothetical protein